jgi:hypothetical protein
MEWQILIAILIAIPVMIFPVALIWYINPGGILNPLKEARMRRAEHGKGHKTA